MVTFGWWRRAAASIALLLAIGGCVEKNSYAPPPPPKVTVATPTQGPVTLYTEFTGNTAPLAIVDLEARVQGFLTAINYTDGQLVKKDAVLFQIERDSYQALVDLAKAQLESAKATQANAKRESDRQTTLGRQDVASQKTVENAKTALDTAVAQVAVATANLKSAEINLGYTTVRAPFDGVVSRHLADVGALVGSSGPTKLATIQQIDPIYVYFNISEQQQISLRDDLISQGKSLKDMREKKQALPVEAALAGDTAFQYQGSLDYIAPALDAATGTLQMRARFDNADAALIPGQFVRVRLPTGKIDQAILVNDTAVMSNQAGAYVMVVGKDDAVEQRPVTTGPVVGQLRVILSGLAAADRVVIGRIQRAVAGNKVQPEAGQMAAMPDGPKPAPAALTSGAKSTP